MSKSLNRSISRFCAVHTRGWLAFDWLIYSMHRRSIGSFTAGFPSTRTQQADSGLLLLISESRSLHPTSPTTRCRTPSTRY